MTTELVKAAPKASNFRSICTIVITSVGLGILELPASVAKVGSLNFAVLMLLTGYASWWGIQLLHRCLMLGNGEYHSYSAVGYAAYGQSGQVFVGLCMHVTLTGICACLLVLLGKTMEPLCPLSGFLAPWTRVFWVVIGALVAQPFVWLRSLNKLGIVSAVGVVAVFILGTLIVIASIREIATQAEKAETPLADFGMHGLGFTIIMLCFSFGSIPAIPAVFLSMAKPQDFKKVSAVAYLIIGFITALVAYAGFFAWGRAAMDVGDVLDIIAPVEKSSVNQRKLDWLGYSCLYVAVLVVLTHLIVLIRPVADAAEEATSAKSTPLRLLSRSLPSLVMLVIGLTFKELSLTMLVVGSVSVMLLTLLIPAVLYQKLYRSKNIALPNAKRFWTSVVFITVASGFSSVVGVITAIKALIN